MNKKPKIWKFQGRIMRCMIVVCAAGFFNGVAVAEDMPSISRGETILQKNCSRCHGIGMEDKSAHPQAPEFRTLFRKYDPEDLEESLAEGISTGHPDMPEFQATPEQIADIVGYLKTLGH